MKKLLYLFLVISAIFISCEKDGIEGPSLNDLFGELNILEAFTVVNDSAVFNGESAYFTAKFSKIVDWKISIIGLSSGAEKVILGKSNEINASNSIWRGEVTSLPFFIEESCAVKLTFPSHSDTAYGSFVINGAKIYGDGTEAVIADFEGGWNPNLDYYFNAGQVRTIVSTGAGQGSKYLKQESSPNGCHWDWLIGYVDYEKPFWLDQKVLSANPDDVYFNIMIFGDSTLSPQNVPNSLFKLEFYEDENQDGFWSQSSEDMLFHEFLVDWKGWRMVSLKYSELEISSGSGNKIREPNKIYSVKTLLLADPYELDDTHPDFTDCSGFAKADVDYIVWSEGSAILNQ